jgi:Winged helix DNA-binding domain
VPARRGISALVAERLTAQLLAGPPAGGPVAVAERLLAIQAQDPRGARLAVRARTDGLSAADVDRALTDDRSLVVTWLNRGTLHLVRSEDYPWLHALTAPPLFTGNARRLAQEGVAPEAAERAVAVVERSLAEEGPLTRDELRERIDAAGVRTQGQALVHVLMLASLRGVAVRGPVRGARHAYVLVRDWLGEPAPVERARALAELARRYLAGHGPADDRDLARWAGLPLREARAGLAAIAPELAERADGLVELARRPRPGEPPPARLLGSYEPLLLGWRSRAPFLGSHEPAVVAQGVFRPFALVRGRAAATWRLRDGDVVLEPLEPLAGEDAAALEADAADVARYLSLRAPRPMNLPRQGRLTR